MAADERNEKTVLWKGESLNGKGGRIFVVVFSRIAGYVCFLWQMAAL